MTLPRSSFHCLELRPCDSSEEGAYFIPVGLGPLIAPAVAYPEPPLPNHGENGDPPEHKVLQYLSVLGKKGRRRGIEISESAGIQASFKRFVDLFTLEDLLQIRA
jgi:hypothetical protein